MSANMNCTVVKVKSSLISEIVSRSRKGMRTQVLPTGLPIAARLTRQALKDCQDMICDFVHSPRRLFHVFPWVNRVHDNLI